MLKKLFGFDSETMKVRTEIMAGITTFLTMAYILAVNPGIFDALGGVMSIENGAVFTATALAAVVGCVAMAFIGKKPFGLAPGMGLNAFFVYTVCLTMGYSWQFALTGVFIEGIIFIILTVTNVRKLIVDAIPLSLKSAIGGGIGLFIVFIGMQNAGIIVDGPTLVTLGNITEGSALLAIIGLVLTAVLVILKVPGGILIGILGTTFIGCIPMFKVDGTYQAITHLSGIAGSVPGIGDIAGQMAFAELTTSKGIIDMIVVVLTFLFIDMFDTMGSIIGVAEKAGFIDEKGNIERINECFMADAIATTTGAALGTSTTTTYVESASGVGVGGRSGLTALVVGVCFALALPFAPLFLAIPSAATAPALIIVGMMMLSPICKIDWTDFTEALPAFVTFSVMPLAYSISDGILLGMIAYVVINALCGKIKKISVAMWVLAVLFVLRYIFL